MVYRNSLLIDVNVTDGNTHQALDWDQDMRAETIKVHDASTGAVLDSRFLSAGSFIEAPISFGMCEDTSHSR
jgi:hypothetical protein